MKNTPSAQCPVCGQDHGHLVRRFHPDADAPLVEQLRAEKPQWKPAQGACTRCLDQANLELQLSPFEGKGEPGEVNGYKILPTPRRHHADADLTGKGVTICFIDSGFYPHPDLIHPENRILKMLDITQPERGEAYFSQPRGNAWHGAMTTVVCAGNGRLSGGKYRGLAPEARLVLLKVMDENGAITTENITQALKWAVKNRKQYQIRIINLSVSGDEAGSYEDSPISRAVQEAVSKGITVVAAAGNDPTAELKAPANSPHAITVGGLDDQNTLNPFINTLYHSTFGETADRLQKPDLIAPAIWLAAPLLPGTREQREAAALFSLAGSEDLALKAKLANLLRQTRLDARLLSEKNKTVRQAVANRIAEAKYISPHYQHADGTSFAAPIVCSAIAQILEANPRLDPLTIREILLATARKLPGEQADRQGWGVIQPAHAVQMAGGKNLAPLPGVTPVIDYRRMAVDFYFRHPDARAVVLTGDFLSWRREGIPLEENGGKGLWQQSVPFTQRGIYRYKFLIDGNTWLSDPRNLFGEQDGFNGFNSKLIIP